MLLAAAPVINSAFIHVSAPSMSAELSTVLIGLAIAYCPSMA
jgi:hypothetical protein